MGQHLRAQRVAAPGSGAVREAQDQQYRHAQSAVDGVAFGDMEGLVPRF